MKASHVVSCNLPLNFCTRLLTLCSYVATYIALYIYVTSNLYVLSSQTRSKCIDVCAHLATVHVFTLYSY